MKKLVLLLAIIVSQTLKAQNVGIGTTTPLAKLHISNGASGNTTPFSPLVVEGNNNTYINLLSPNTSETGLLFGKADNAASGAIVFNNVNTLNGFQFRTNGNSTKMVLDQNGNVGIGTATPFSPLTLNNNLGQKISLYGNASNNYGIGVQSYLMQLHTDAAVSDIAFGYGASGNFFENMRIKGNGNVGIGTLNPTARLHVVDSSVVFQGLNTLPVTPGNTSVSGAGSRMMWFADKAAFRSGYVGGLNWDKDYIGLYSVATGFDTRASGIASTAMGTGTIASGDVSTAMGLFTTASGNNSTAMGRSTTARSQYETVLGVFNTDYTPANNSTDRIFSVGNGTANNLLSDAIVISKNGNIYIDASNKNDGTLTGNTLLFGTSNGTGEGIGSKRTATGNQYGLDFYTGSANRMSITNGGQVGIGNSNPAYQLDVSNRMRIRSGGNLTNTAGLWLNNYANTEAVFIGMENDSHIGFFAVGIGWKFGMNTQTGALKVNGSEGQPGQVIVSAGAAAPSWGYANSHYIGETYGGGIVFYVYDNGQHGLIAATTDQGVNIRWNNGVFRYTGSTGDGLGAGAMNTALIVATQLADNQFGNFAAKICADYAVTIGGITYGDWYLPSKAELSLLCIQSAVVGISGNTYWSSTEVNNVEAWYIYIYIPNNPNCVSGSRDKSSAFDNVRAIRSF
jgi:hypothetical protein